MGSAQKPNGNTVAEAFDIWKLHGERAPHFVAEQIRSLAMADDIMGVRRLQQISAALAQLMHGDNTKQASALAGPTPYQPTRIE